MFFQPGSDQLRGGDKVLKLKRREYDFRQLSRRDREFGRPGHIQVFHSTSSKSAASIAQRIRLSRGHWNSKCTVDPSFYVTKSIWLGMKWNERRTRSSANHTTAVIAYTIPEEMFEDLKVYNHQPNDFWKMRT